MENKSKSDCILGMLAAILFIHYYTILSVVLYGCEIWSLTHHGKVTR